MATTWEMNYLKVQQKCGNTFQDKDNDRVYFFKFKTQWPIRSCSFCWKFLQIFGGARGGWKKTNKRTNLTEPKHFQKETSWQQRLTWQNVKAGIESAWRTGLLQAPLRDKTETTVSRLENTSVSDYNIHLSQTNHLTSDILVVSNLDLVCWSDISEITKFEWSQWG